MVNNPFYVFIQLVEHDQKINQLQRSYEQLQQRINALTELQNQETTSIQLLRKQIAAHELEHKSLQAQEKKLRAKLDVVSSVKEYSALEAELKIVTERAQREENATLALWEQVEIAERGSQSTLWGNEIATHTQEREQIARELETIRAERDKLVQQAPEEYVKRYETMRSSVRNPVVAVVENRCSGCSVQVMPADLAQLRRHVLVTCKSCYRLLYMV